MDLKAGLTTSEILIEILIIKPLAVHQVYFSPKCNYVVIVDNFNPCSHCYFVIVKYPALIPSVQLQIAGTVLRYVKCA